MKKYRTLFIMGIQKAFEYRADFFLSLFSSVFPIIIQVSMWTAIYKASKSGILYGYTYPQMILYTFFVGIVSKFLATGFVYEMNDDIKNGGLNKYIVKPINYCLYRISCFLGERTSVSVVFIVAMIIIMGIFGSVGYFQINLIRIVTFFIAIILTLLLNFAVYFCVGLLGLWISEISRLFPAISIILTVISGGIFPLDILGQNSNGILFLLPFKYMLQFPVDIISGKEGQYSVYAALLIQLGWVVIFILISNLLWKRGLKKYIAVGG